MAPVTTPDEFISDSTTAFLATSPPKVIPWWTYALLSALGIILMLLGCIIMTKSCKKKRRKRLHRHLSKSVLVMDIPKETGIEKVDRIMREGALTPPSNVNYDADPTFRSSKLGMRYSDAASDISSASKLRRNMSELAQSNVSTNNRRFTTKTGGSNGSPPSVHSASASTAALRRFNSLPFPDKRSGISPAEQASAMFTLDPKHLRRPEGPHSAGYENQGFTQDKPKRSNLKTRSTTSVGQKPILKPALSTNSSTMTGSSKRPSNARSLSAACPQSDTIPAPAPYDSSEWVDEVFSPIDDVAPTTETTATKHSPPLAEQSTLSNEPVREETQRKLDMPPQPKRRNLHRSMPDTEGGNSGQGQDNTKAHSEVQTHNMDLPMNTEGSDRTPAVSHEEDDQGNVSQDEHITMNMPSYSERLTQHMHMTATKEENEKEPMTTFVTNSQVGVGQEDQPIVVLKSTSDKVDSGLSQC